MKKFSVLILLTLLLQTTLFSQSNFDECTIGVALGSATQDGRPLLWKARDLLDPLTNVEARFVSSHDYNYISVFTASSNYPSMGVNEHGLAILNSLTYDLTAAATGPNATEIVIHALGYCKTIDEFQEYLDSTNITGRQVTCNYGMIDSTGAAVLFEVGGYEYWRFDASDAPGGYVIRTNFTINGGGNVGMDRFIRSSELILNFVSGDSLGYKSLIRYHMRDFSDYNSQPYPVPFLGQINSVVPYGYFPANYSICRDISTSSAVIQGIKPDEKPELSTMWAMLGQPAAAICCPYWPVGETPSYANGTPMAPLCDIAIEIRELLFDLPNFPTCINSLGLRDTTGGGLWTCTFPVEDLILDSAEAMLNQWRILDSIPVTGMLESEEDLAETAYNTLLECCSLITSNESVTVTDEFNLYPNPASNTISLVSQSGTEITLLEIIDSQGRALMLQKVTNHQLSYDISNLPKGLYFLRINTGKGIEVKKLVVQ